MIDWKMAERTVALMNELLAADPEAVLAMCENRVVCNETLANHPTVQVSGYPDPNALEVNGPIYRVGLIGVLNGLCGALGPEGGDKEGWGVIAAVYSDLEIGPDKITGFKMTKCEQCCNPHHDGICSCGGWGKDEEKKAAEWHKKNQPRLDAEARSRAASTEKSLNDHNATLTDPIEKLEGLWDGKAGR